MAPITRNFVRRIERLAADKGIEIVPFEKGQRKDDVALARYARFPKEEGAVFIGRLIVRWRNAETARMDEGGWARARLDLSHPLASVLQCYGASPKNYNALGARSPAFFEKPGSFES